MPLSRVNRRDLLRLALGGAAMPVAGMARPTRLKAQSVPAVVVTVGEAREPFTAVQVLERARGLAAKPYKPPASAPLGALGEARPGELAAIRYRPAELIWADEDGPFAIEPLHRTPNLPGQLELHTVDGGAVSAVAYHPGKFDFGTLKPPPDGAELGFTGMRVLHRGDGDRLRPVASVLDASLVSAIARGQVWGAISRPLTVRTADRSGEEVPHIRSVWIEKPKAIATQLVMHAVLDTPSLAAAVRFTLRAGEATVIDTECTIFTRKRVEHLGLAPVQATYLHGPLDRSPAHDMRPAVYEAGGVQMLTGRGEWVWRPVANRRWLQISGFVDDGPQGFGLIQRQRAFSAFLDDENAWQRRPSVWIEPIGNWGPGEVTLLEIPAVSENNKNIACYWRPRAALDAGSETSFAYRQFWSWRPPSRPHGATVTASRMGRIPGDASQMKSRILVQFEGGSLVDSAKADTIVPAVWASAGKISAVQVFRTPRQGSMRVVFDLDPAGRKSVELRLVLKQNDAPMSETWLYRWTQ